MLSHKTAAQIDHGLAALRLAQAMGDIDGETVPMPGDVSLGTLARYSGVSEATIQGVERMALAKLFLALSESGELPPHLCRRIDNPPASDTP